MAPLNDHLQKSCQKLDCPLWKPRRPLYIWPAHLDDPDHLQKKIVRNLTNLYAFRRLDDPDNNKKVCYKIGRPLCIWPGNLDDPDHLQKVFRNLTVLFG